MASQHRPVLIEAESGTPTIRSIQIPAGGSIVIGRLAECDLADPNDLHLSRQHCRIEYRAPDCILRNLSSNGTLVNGQPADGVRLRDGDRIECSQLVLKVSFGKEEAPTQRVASAEITTRHDRQGTYAVEACRSGLLRYTGMEKRPGPVELLERLSALGPVYAIIDFRKSGVAPPEHLTEQDYLFHWIPEDLMRDISPAVLAAADTEQFLDLIRQGWGKDGIICLLSRAAHPALVKHLQQATGYDPNHPAGGMLGYCWPGVLNQLLQHQPPGTTKTLLQGIDAVLLEAVEAPGGWHLYGDAKLEEQLQGAGLVRISDESKEKSA